jgi:hypothetical protein
MLAGNVGGGIFQMESAEALYPVQAGIVKVFQGRLSKEGPMR